MPVTHEPWLVALSLIVAIQGAYVGLSLAVQVGEAAGAGGAACCSPAPRFRSRVAIWTMHFVGMLAARLPFPVDYLVFPTLLSFLVCVIVVGAAVFAASAGPLTLLRLAASAVPHGRRHLHHALHRHEGAPCQRSHDPRSALRRGEHGRRHRRVRPGALARHRPGAPAAAHPLGGRLRHRHLRHALHGHGRADAVAARRPVVGRAGAVDRPPRHRRGGRGLHRFGHLSPAAGAGPPIAAETATGRACVDGDREPRRFRASTRRDRPRLRSPSHATTWDTAATRRSAAPARRRRRFGPPAAGRARRRDPFGRGRRRRRGPRQRPLHLHSSTAATSSSARSRSATSSRGSTATASPASTAATSSMSTASSA